MQIFPIPTTSRQNSYKDPHWAKFHGDMLAGIRTFRLSAQQLRRQPGRIQLVHREQSWRRCAHGMCRTGDLDQH